MNFIIFLSINLQMDLLKSDRPALLLTLHSLM